MPATMSPVVSAVARPLSRSDDDAVAGVPQIVFRDEGGAAANATLRIALTLRYRNRNKLDRLVEEQGEAGSSQYRRWLSNEQFNAEYAPAEGDYTRVASSLERAGIRVTRTFPNRTVVDAVGSIGRIERYFDTRIHRVSQPGYGERYVNTHPAYAPSDLKGILLAVDGLSTLAAAKPFYEGIKNADRLPRTPERIGGHLWGPVSAGSGVAGYGPIAFAQGYDFPIQHTSKSGKSYDGTGRAVGTVMDADFFDSDLDWYLAYFRVVRTGPSTTRVFVDGGPPSGYTADSVEATLDAQTLVSLAPGAALYVYEMPSIQSNTYITDTYNQVVSDNKVDTLNSCFGVPEGALPLSTAKAWDAIAEQGAAKGITFHAASGDSGGGYVYVPATSPHVVAVGGTTLNLTKTGRWYSETGWGYEVNGGWIGSTGGVSQVFPTPPWQAVASGVVPTGRNVPDVAFDGDPYTGTALYYNGSWNSKEDPIGGTSLASPIFGAAIAEIDQMVGGRTGLAGPALFKLWEKDGYSSGNDLLFHEITQGFNGVDFDHSGYNLVTGIGSMEVWHVAQKL